MRLLTLATAAALLTAAVPGFAPAFAQGVKDSKSILLELMPQGGDAADSGGAVVIKKSRGIKHNGTAAATPAATATAVAATPDAKPDPKPASSLIVLFASGSADLTDAGRVQLDQAGLALKDPSLSGAHFRIEGHTDTTGDAATNKALSERRAVAVVSYLAQQYGLDRGKFVPVGMGKDGLAVATPDQTPEPRNRRVVLINLDG